LINYLYDLPPTGGSKWMSATHQTAARIRRELSSYLKIALSQQVWGLARLAKTQVLDIR
jgi:hypothetical protein